MIIDEQQPVVTKLGELNHSLSKSEIITAAEEHGWEIVGGERHTLQRAAQIDQKMGEYSHATVNVFT